MFSSIRKYFAKKSSPDTQQLLNLAALEAAGRRHFKTMFELIDRGASIAKVGVFGGTYTTVTEEVFSSNNLSAMEGLLSRGLDPNTRHPFNGAPLLASAFPEKNHYRDHNIQRAKLLLRHGAKADYQFENLETIQDRATRYVDVELNAMIAAALETPPRQLQPQDAPPAPLRKTPPRAAPPLIL